MAQAMSAFITVILLMVSSTSFAEETGKIDYPTELADIFNAEEGTTPFERYEQRKKEREHQVREAELQLTTVDRAMQNFVLILLLISPILNIWLLPLGILSNAFLSFLEIKHLVSVTDLATLAAGLILVIAIPRACTTAKTQWKDGRIGKLFLWWIMRPTVWPIVGCWKVLNWAIDITIVSIVEWYREKQEKIQKQLNERRKEQYVTHN